MFIEHKLNKENVCAIFRTLLIMTQKHDLNRVKRTRLAKKVMNDASKLDFHVTLLKRVSRKDTKSHYQPRV